MEAFESFVALALETEGLVVSEAVKFPIQRRTSKAMHEETQTHGYEVDLVGARADRLVLATVKSFLGSRGVVAEDVVGTGKNRSLYKLLNDVTIREGVLAGACARYGYTPGQVEFRLYAGRFAAPVKGVNEKRVKDWCADQKVGAGMSVYGLEEVVPLVRALASSKTYRNSAALTAINVLDAAGMLN